MFVTLICYTISKVKNVNIDGFVFFLAGIAECGLWSQLFGGL
jgi:hypothetical protein